MFDVLELEKHDFIAFFLTNSLVGATIDKFQMNFLESEEETRLMWETMSAANQEIDRCDISTRVYVGAADNPQYQSFLAAWGCTREAVASHISPKRLLNPEYLFLEKVTRLHLTISEIIDWLLCGDIHF